MSNTNNFFAILTDDSVRRINLLQSILPDIQNVFINGSAHIINPDFDEVEFDGNYLIEEDEVLFVNMELLDTIQEATKSAINVPILDLNTDEIKTLFWYESNVYYFQTFDKRKMLRNKNVLFYDKQTYTKLEENAFIIDNIVHAVYKDKKFYFKSYANANKIFSLMAFYEAATNEDIKSFSRTKNVELDADWFTENANTVLRKHITLLQKSKILTKADTKKVKRDAKQFKLKIELDSKGKIIFPNDKKVCRDILTFLNEQFYVGLITGNKYRTNSKKSA